MMRSLSLLSLLLLMVSFSHAQTIWNRSGSSGEIHSLAGNSNHTGFFGGFGVKKTDLHDENVLLGSFKLGMTANRALAFGIEGQGFIPSTTITGLYPQQDVIPLGGYGGVFIEPIFFSNSVIHFTIPVSGGAGWLGFHEDWSKDQSQHTELIEGDVFWYTELGGTVELNVTKHLRFGVGISKRFVQDLNLEHTQSSDFSGINYNFSLKIGRF